jgi:hypothetical protein
MAAGNGFAGRLLSPMSQSSKDVTGKSAFPGNRRIPAPPSDPENPYQPLVPSKPVVVVTSKGSGEYEAGGALESLNFLEPHLATILGFIGLGEISYTKVAREETKDELWQQMVREAEETVDRLAGDLAGP